MNVILLLGAVLLTQPQPAEAWLDIASAWRFKPDPDHVGLREGWHDVPYDDADWAVIDAGTRWEDHGFPEVDGYAWYRRRVDVPADWKASNVWLVLGAVNDACTIHCNGVRVNSYGDEKDHTVAGVPVIAELGAQLHPGEANLIAIECFDWGGSGGLWHLPCALTTDPTRLPLTSVVNCLTEYENRQIAVNLDFSGLGTDRPDMTLMLALFKNDKKKPVAESTLVIPATAFTASTVFDMGDPDGGDVYHTRLVEARPNLAGLAELPIDQPIPWPEAPRWGGDYANLQVRNNFVTELARMRMQAAGTEEILLLNPRDGWVFITAKTKGGEGPRVVVDEDTSPVLWRTNPQTGAFEAMRYLRAGRHNVTVAPDAKGTFEIRAIPELMYCYYPAAPHIKAFGPYNWAFVSRFVLPHVNTLIMSSPATDNELNRWLREGRAWVSNASLPGLGKEKAPTADEVYAIWAANPGVTRPGFVGMIVDEFLYASAEHYRAWTEAMTRIHENEAFEGRTFYAWCGDLYKVNTSTEFQQRVTELGNRFAWEKYLPEVPTEAEAAGLIGRDLQQRLVEWQAQMPDVAARTVMTLGYLCAPPESLNLNPAVDYHVFMDMQFHRLATEPAFWGLYGVMEYSASYADEESLRWAHRLFRHYCIEGSRERFTTDPYVLPHAQNPDFLDGLNGWQVEAAEEGSIASGTMEGFSWLQGRYPRTSDGDQFCRMTRSGTRPNRVSQQLQALQPGRLYSVKLIGADLDHLDREQSLAVRIQVEEAEVLSEFCFSVPYFSNYAHEFGPYNREHPAWFTFQRYVFRAATDSARLTISDWIADDTPGGDAGQNVAFNFVEVQPFRAPE